MSLNQYRLAAACIIGSGLMFASMGACIKSVSHELPNEIIVFLRNLFGLLALLPVLIKVRKVSLKTDVLHWHLLRTFSGLGAMYCFFYAISQITLSTAVLLNFTTPLFAPVIAFLWLKEGVSNTYKIALGVGFIGIALILKPGASVFSSAALIALCSGFLAAVAMVTIRRMHETEPAVRIVFYYSIVCTGVSAIPLLWAWQTVSWAQIGVMAAAGLFATMGQLLVTHGYKLSPVAKVGPFVYTSVVFASLYGWMFWQEWPDHLTFAGILLVAIAGVIALRQKPEIVKTEGLAPR